MQELIYDFHTLDVINSLYSDILQFWMLLPQCFPNKLHLNFKRVICIYSNNYQITYSDTGRDQTLYS